MHHGISGQSTGHRPESLLEMRVLPGEPLGRRNTFSDVDFPTRDLAEELLASAASSLRFGNPVLSHRM